MLVLTPLIVRIIIGWALSSASADRWDAIRVGRAFCPAKWRTLVSLADEKKEDELLLAAADVWTTNGWPKMPVGGQRVYFDSTHFRKVQTLTTTKLFYKSCGPVGVRLRLLVGRTRMALSTAIWCHRLESSSTRLLWWMIASPRCENNSDNRMCRASSCVHSIVSFGWFVREMLFSCLSSLVHVMLLVYIISFWRFMYICI